MGKSSLPLLWAAVLAVAYPAGARQRPVVWNNPDGPRASGMEHAALKSPSMGLEVGYNVWLPPGYAGGTGRFPAIYFLHGAGGNENSDGGGFSGLVRRAIDAGKLPPAICVFPNGGLSGYADHPDTRVMVETMIIRELIPAIDGKYRTIARREGRALAGFSMGGGGAVRLGLKYPELFCCAASWAGAFRYGGGADPAAIAREKQAQLKGKTALLLIVGDQDLTFRGHAPVVEALQAAGIEHQYRVLPGINHNLGEYHRLTGDELVAFLGRQLKAAAAP